MSVSVETIRKNVEAQSQFVARLRSEIATVIVGQQYMVDRLLVGILAMAANPYDRWVRFVFPLMVKMWVLGSIALAVAVAIGYA